MAINHGILDIMLDKDDGQQLETGKTMIDVGLLTRTHGEVTAGSITAAYLVT